MTAEDFETLQKRRRERSLKRLQRRSDASRLVPMVEKELPPNIKLQNPAEGVYQFRDGTGPVLFQWWPGAAAWSRVKDQKKFTGDVGELIRWIRKRRWEK